LHTKRSVSYQMNDTKEYIIDQAYKLFLSHSYEAVTISDISKAVGLTKGALYHHFINKEEVFKGVIDKYLNLDIIDQDVKYDTLLQFINGSIDNTKRIVANSLGANETFVPINHISLLIDALRHYPGFESDKELLISKQIEEIKSIMYVAVNTGEIRDNLDIEITALNFFSISLGLASNLYTYKSASVAFEIYSRQLYDFYKLIRK
jgi:TetR/AcrR family transcriptional regulator, transcriptional repressor for nem operon